MALRIDNRTATTWLAIITLIVAIAVPACVMMDCTMLVAPMSHPGDLGGTAMADCLGQMLAGPSTLGITPTSISALIVALLALFVFAGTLFSARTEASAYRVTFAEEPPPPPSDPRGERLRI